MLGSQQIRQKIATDLCINKKPINKNFIDKLEQILTILLRTYKNKQIYPEGKIMPLNMDYEINELQKDIFFLKRGENDFKKYLGKLHKTFDTEVNNGVNKMKNIAFKNFITDRDGTINNYCSRYVTSVQPAYNAVFLTGFVKKYCIEKPIILTSAPLDNTGIVDISVNPEAVFIYAGSKGREYIDKCGNRNSFPIEKEKQKKLDEFNKNLLRLLKNPEYSEFSFVGSGLQLKFGQTTIARQDINNSVQNEKSVLFLNLIKQLVKKIDPEEIFFRIEDTGKDIEVILTIEQNNKQEEIKDFDKGDAVKFLNNELNLNLSEGPNLICGDTTSDIPMIKASMQYTNETYTLFVTDDEELKKKVTSICPNSFFVSQPDILVSILNDLALLCK